MIDLVALVADTDAEWTFRTLLEQRTGALHIRPVTCHVFRHPGRDAGVYLHAHDLLRPYVRRASYALVALDREGSGQEHRKTAQDMEQEIEGRLWRNGWQDADGRSRCAAIVLDPELEVWVWSRSPHVPSALGLDQAHIDAILASLPRSPDGKPERPKEAMERVLRTARKPLSADIFRELAERVSLNAHERAFDKLRHVLQCWFGVEAPGYGNTQT